MISTNPSTGDRTLVLVPISTENAVRMITHNWELAWGKHGHKGKKHFFSFSCAYAMPGEDTFYTGGNRCGLAQKLSSTVRAGNQRGTSTS